MNGSSSEGISNKCFVSDEEIRLKNHLACTFLMNYIVYIEIISTSNQGNFFLKAPKMSTCDPSCVGEGCVTAVSCLVPKDRVTVAQRTL